MDDLIQNISDAHPGYTSFITHLAALASTHLPPFIYITHPGNPSITSAVINPIFHALPALYAHVNAVACFTPRLFYDTVLNQLADWKPSWKDGSQVWPGDDNLRYNDSMDSFLHGLHRLRLERTQDSNAKVNSKGKGKDKGKAIAAVEQEQAPPMVIFIEKAERLAERLPELMVPLSRLAELSRINVSVVMLSSASWEDIRPALGASPDPYYVDVEPLAKRDILQRLVSAFRRTSTLQSSSDLTYHIALQPLYEQYVETLYNAISIYTNDPIELQYVAAARWPGFVKPVISQYGELVRQAEEDGFDPPELAPPATDGRLRLLKFFLPTFTAALNSLYPRLDNAADWAAQHDHDADGEAGSSTPTCGVKVDHLPRMSKFILIAAFVASTNPPKSDLRMFGRGPEERKKRRRKSTSPKKGGAQTIVKVSQRLLGPATFPLDRLLAILGALLEENDYDTRPHDPRFELPGEYTDMEIGRIHVYAAIMELTLMRALHRTSAVDKLDGPPMFKCGISHDVALAIARDLDVPLHDWLWDPS